MKKNNKKDFIYNKNTTKSTVRTQKQSTLKDKLNKILFWVLIGAFCLFSVGSIMGILAFRNDDYKVHADSVETQYQFYGSNIWLECQQMSPANIIPTVEGNAPYNFRWSFSTLQNNNNIRFAFSASYSAYFSNMLSLVRADNFTWYNPGNGGLTDEVQITLQSGPNMTTRQGYYFLLSSSQDLNTVGTYCNILVTNNGDNILTANIIRVDMGSAKMYDGFYNGHSYNMPSSYYNFLRYIDINGNFVEFQFPVSASSPYVDSFLLKSRTYYLSNDFDNNNFYQQGLYDGIQQGKQEGITIGEEQAVNKYKDQWLQQGRQEGIASANEYTFLGLISAAVDAPLQALMGLLNFDLLGINFFGLFGGLLTLGIIMFIVRMVM